MVVEHLPLRQPHLVLMMNININIINIIAMIIANNTKTITINIIITITAIVTTFLQKQPIGPFPTNASRNGQHQSNNMALANIKYLYSSSKVFFCAIVLMLFLFPSPIKCGFPFIDTWRVYLLLLLRLNFSFQNTSFDLLSGTHLE